MHVSGSKPPWETGSASQTSSRPLFEGKHCILPDPFRLDGATNHSRLGAIQDPFLSPDSSAVDVTSRLQNALRRQNEMSNVADDTGLGTTSPSTLISLDIKLTTTMDMLRAREVPLQTSFSFFVEMVDSPSITPYDSVNWERMKLEMVELGISNAAIASTILAVSALYKGQLYQLPLSKALSLYNSSKSTYEKLLNDDSQDFDTTLAATFLLCLFESIHYEIAPILKEPAEIFTKRLKAWAEDESSHSERSSRIIVWLRLLHVTSIRGGNMGLISDSICNLFPNYRTGLPNLKPPLNNPSNASTDLYLMLSTPLFIFYVQLQMISGDVAKLTHYHRSRTTGMDQEEIVQQLTQVKSQLRALWEECLGTQSQSPEDLRAYLAPKIANPMITLIGICTAAYHAELVELDRVLGDPVTESPYSKQAMRRIRKIIDGDWNAYDLEGKLNPAYLRPLFLYAIECMDHDQTQWAIGKMGKIRDPICRSDFFVAFAKALSDAQFRNGRRVTTKYFCIWYFGVSPPFI